MIVSSSPRRPRSIVVIDGRAAVVHVGVADEREIGCRQLVPVRREKGLDRRGADLLLALEQERQAGGQLACDCLPGAAGFDEGQELPLVVRGAAAADHRALGRLLHHGVEGRACPQVQRIDRLDVVVAIEEEVPSRTRGVADDHRLARGRGVLLARTPKSPRRATSQSAARVAIAAVAPGRSRSRGCGRTPSAARATAAGRRRCARGRRRGSDRDALAVLLGRSARPWQSAARASRRVEAAPASRLGWGRRNRRNGCAQQSWRLALVTIGGAAGRGQTVDGRTAERMLFPTRGTELALSGALVAAGAGDRRPHGQGGGPHAPELPLLRHHRLLAERGADGAVGAGRVQLPLERGVGQGRAGRVQCRTSGRLAPASSLRTSCPRATEPGRVQLSWDATNAFRSTYRRVRDEKALAVSQQSGAWKMARGTRRRRHRDGDVQRGRAGDAGRQRLCRGHSRLTSGGNPRLTDIKVAVRTRSHCASGTPQL